MSVNIGEAKGYLDLDITGFLAGLKTAQSQATSATSGIKASMDKIEGAGKSLSSAGTLLTKTVTVPIVAAGAASVTLAAQFESAMSKVKALSGATGDDFEKLKDKAIEMGGKTKFSASEAAEGFQYMALAGWDTGSMLEGIEPILKLAGAAEMDLGTTSDIVTDALTAFGLQAKDTAHFTDVLATTMASSNTDVTQMGEAFKYAAPLAGTLGYSIEDIGLALGTMASSSIKGSQAGTSLRRMLMNMADPTSEVKTAMDELGISMFNVDGSARPLRDVLGQLRTSLSKCTEEQKAQYASALAGATGMSGLLAIVNASDEEWNKLANSVNNANNSTNDMYATMQDNLLGQLTTLKSALETLGISIGNILLPIIKKIVEAVQGWVEKLNNLDEDQKKMIVRIAAVAAAIGPLLLIIGKTMTSVASLYKTFQTLKNVVPVLKSGFSAISAAIGGISAPVVAVVAIIAVLVAAFVNLWNTNEDFRNKITAIWDGIKAKFQEFGDAIVERLNALGFNFSSITDVIKAVWQGFCDFLAPIFEYAFGLVSAVLGTALDMIIGVLDIFIGLFTGNWEQAWNGVKEYFGAIWNGIKEVFSNWCSAASQLLTTVLGWFGINWSNCWNTMKTTVTTILNAIKTVITNTWNAVKTFFTTIWNGISSFIAGVWNGMKETISNVLNAISTVITNVWNKVKEVTTTVWEAIKSAISTPINAAKTIVDTAVNGIQTAIDSKLNSAKATVETIFNAIKTKITEVMEGAKTTVSTAIEKIKGFFNFSWSLPKLKLPHISIKGSFSLNPPSVPTFGISWYRKAMNNAMILNGATIFGMQGNRLLGGGEAGSEVVAGANTLMKMIKSAVANVMIKFIEVFGDYLTESIMGYIHYNGFTSLKSNSRYDDNNSKNKPNSSGDTFIFNSPKAIDEIEAARQLKRMKRNLVEGFV